jgi:hypothetical protein
MDAARVIFLIGSCRRRLANFVPPIELPHIVDGGRP